MDANVCKLRQPNRRPQKNQEKNRLLKLVKRPKKEDPSDEEANHELLTRANANQMHTAMSIILILLLFAGTASCQRNEEAEKSKSSERSINEIATSTQVNFSQFPRDVNHLKLHPDLRSVRLHWIYEHGKANRPARFEIRFCELTSWKAEIKCRHRDWPVDEAGWRSSGVDTRDNGSWTSDKMDSSVIGKQQIVRQLEPNGNAYATQIYDLRALTNYTFEVRVSRFFGENAAKGAQQVAGSQQRQQQQQQQQQLRARQNGDFLHLARKLDLSHDDDASQANLIETKPFSAEAVNCFANSSEVLVNTGKYFAGRISVEGQSDARCQLGGNKSGEQSSYLFRIDHRLCQSKVIDGNRVETMILVHENKDILTHNTARFLVQCNVQQKSFTVKASISLPRIVNGPLRQLAGDKAESGHQSRAAIITPIHKSLLRPNSYDTDKQQTGATVRLGSMPGIYRPIRVANVEDFTASSGEPEPAAPNKWEQATGELTGRQSKEWRERLSDAQPPVGTTLATPPARHFLPTPIDVSSRVLYVQTATSSLSASPSHDLLTTTSPTAQAAANRTAKMVALVEEAADAQGTAGGLAAPITMTNNHRIAGHFLALGQKYPEAGALGDNSAGDEQQPPSASLSSFSIKYSPAKVADYPMERLIEQNQPVSRSRTSRMRADGGELELDRPAASRLAKPLPFTSASPPTDQTDAAIVSSAKPDDGRMIENRMGDMMMTASGESRLSTPMASAPQARAAPAQADQLDNGGRLHATNFSETFPLFDKAQTDANVTQQSLAHNITGVLLKWSLKALGHLARKSLESLVVEPTAESDPLAEPAHLAAQHNTDLIHRSLAQPPLDLHREPLVVHTQTHLHPKTSANPVDKLPQTSRTVVARRLSHTESAPSTQTPHNSSKSHGEIITDGFAVDVPNRRTSSNPAAQTATGPKDPAKSSEPKEKQREDLKQSGRTNEQRRTPRWPFYVMTLVGSLIILTLLFFFLTPLLVSSTSGRKHKTGHNVGPFFGACEAPRSPNERQKGGAQFRTQKEPTPSFVRQTNDGGSQSQLLSCSLETNRSNSQATTNTRSTSAASMSTYSSDHENYCKNNEFLYTDFVLLNQDKQHNLPQTGNESFA